MLQTCSMQTLHQTFNVNNCIPETFNWKQSIIIVADSLQHGLALFEHLAKVDSASRKITFVPFAMRSHWLDMRELSNEVVITTDQRVAMFGVVGKYPTVIVTDEGDAVIVNGAYHGHHE